MGFHVPFVTLLGAAFDLRFRLGEHFETVLAALELFWDVHLRRKVCGVSLFGEIQQVADFRFELLLKFFGVLVAQGPVLRSIGLDFRSVQTDGPDLAKAHLVGDLKDLYEESIDLAEKTFPEGGNGVMVGMAAM